MNVIHFLKLSIHYYTWRILEYDGTPNTPPNKQPKTKNKLEQSRIQQKSRVPIPHRVWRTKRSKDLPRDKMGRAARRAMLIRLCSLSALLAAEGFSSRPHRTSTLNGSTSASSAAAGSSSRSRQQGCIAEESFRFCRRRRRLQVSSSPQEVASTVETRQQLEKMTVKRLRLFIEEKGIDVPRGSNLKLKKDIVDFIWNWQCESERIDDNEGVSEPRESVVVTEENEQPRSEEAESLVTDESKSGPSLPDVSQSIISQSINQQEFVASTTSNNTPDSPVDSGDEHVGDGDGNDDDDGQLMTVGRPKGGPSLSDLEDLEEQRLTALEEEAERQRRRSAQLSTTPSNLYADVYSAASSQAGEQRERPIPDDANPLGRTTQQEIDMAHKRDALQNTRINEMFEEEDATNAARQAKIREMMEEDDKMWKEERKKRLMGKYAGKTLEEVEKMFDEDRKKSEHGTCDMLR